MIVLSHPTGNQFVRAMLRALMHSDALAHFYTTIDTGWLSQALAGDALSGLRRRSFPVPSSKIKTAPAREIVRLLAPAMGFSHLTRHERGWACFDSVCGQLDSAVARSLESGAARELTALYSYEDVCSRSFLAAKQSGLKCIYELPIAYWQTSQRLLAEESERLPEWEPTLGGSRDSQAKLQRKTEELSLADVVICPSRFVLETLPADMVADKQCLVAAFGSPTSASSRQPDRCYVGSSGGDQPRAKTRLRVLFAGSMSQRKGLADLFSAIKLLQREDIELVVMGSLLAPMEFYRQQLAGFTYEKPRDHSRVLELMRSCDLLVLPSIVEGRALVQQEAMVCGLPIIVTANAGGEDLVEEGRTGFLVPIRNPQALAEKIGWCADNRQMTSQMGLMARQKALEITWSAYSTKILNLVMPARPACGASC